MFFFHIIVAFLQCFFPSLFPVPVPAIPAPIIPFGVCLPSLFYSFLLIFLLSQVGRRVFFWNADGSIMSGEIQSLARLIDVSLLSFIVFLFFTLLLIDSPFLGYHSRPCSFGWRGGIPSLRSTSYLFP